MIAEPHSKTRPPLLNALCILSFLGSSVSLISYLLSALFFEKTSELIIRFSSWHSTEAISPLYFMLLALLFSISLIGVFRIWKLHRDGLYLYSLAQLAILFLPVIWIGTASFSMVNAVFTAVFITGYLINLKYLK